MKDIVSNNLLLIVFSVVNRNYGRTSSVSNIQSPSTLPRPHRQTLKIRNSRETQPSSRLSGDEYEVISLLGGSSSDYNLVNLNC